jgi:hypothetical protein
MSGQINRTGLRDLHRASADIVQVTQTWRRPTKRFRPAFAGHRPASRRTQLMVAHIAEFVGLLVLVLAVSAAVAALAYVIVQMWAN